MTVGDWHVQDIPEPQTTRDCKHGQLARSCAICALEAEIERLNQVVADLQALCHRAAESARGYGLIGGVYETLAEA